MGITITTSRMENKMTRVVNNTRDYDQEIWNVWSALANSVEEMTDAEIREECLEQGVDIKEQASYVYELLLAAVRKATSNQNTHRKL